MKLNHTDVLQTQGRNFTEDNVSYPAPPPPFSAIFSGDAVPFGSRDSIMEEILEALEKDDVKVLGVYGMDDKESDVVRAGRLHEKLEKTGKVLVILDDLWKHLDLHAVGIPSPDKHKCCKIVITTREKDVCDQMDCKDNIFSVMVLSEEEGWHLFKKMAGDCVTSAEVEPVAIEVAKECGGLPLAIVVVARALKDKNPTRWKDALRQLQVSAPTNIKGMHKDVYSRLQLSYDYLDGEEIKHFFLLFSLFPEDSDIPIEWPMWYGMGLGLFHGTSLGGTMQEAREKADSFVDILKSACLLLDGDEGTIRVHDVIRDFCISSIASKGQPHVFLVKSGRELTEWPEIDCSVDYTAISLVDNNIKQFPCGLDCPKLKCLVFIGSGQEVNIANSFFDTMRELKVLDISWVRIPLFPPSQGLLGKLRTLRLHGCSLGEMEMIGDLKGLEVLSLNESHFKGNVLPKGISLLTRLRLLDLSECSELLIPYGILSNLSRLEELYLDDSFDKWEKESEEEFHIESFDELEKEGKEVFHIESFDESEKESEEEFYIENSRRRERYASLSELKSSSHSLTTLEMQVKDVRLFPKDLFFPKLTTFQIEIGDVWEYEENVDENDSLSKATLMVDFKGSSIAKGHGICTLMKRCDCLEMRHIGNMKRILYDFNRDLKVLAVEKSKNIEEIIISEEGEAVFPQLKCLGLYDLPKLASFCNVRQNREPIPSQSLFTNKVTYRMAFFYHNLCSSV
ncbi:NB-ARC [Dillenia turbinata]|uniref:NB-ARC n=1 Tax=Dillenia turbinata TaxID=194707 RepID=A0AAN8VGD8_9MAGN